jgi:putative addiction module killer protein
VTELRVDYGPGYRVYLTRKGQTLIILLFDAQKSSQQRDIAKALELAEEA